MEHQVLSAGNHCNISHIKPTYTHKLFDFSEKIKDVSSWKMVISPEGENTILIAKENGIVSRFSLDKDWKEESLIKHPWVTHTPMFVAANKQGSLVIVSTGGYMNTTNREGSECCIWQNGSTKIKYFKSLLSVIALNREGNLLITADQNQTKTISIIDLDTDKVCFNYIYSPDKSDCVIDVAFNSSDKLLVIAKTSGITVMDWNGKMLNMYNKNVSYINDIRQVCFPAHEDIVYATQDNKVKLVNIFGAMNDQVAPTILFEQLLNYQVVIDKENGEIAAFWTNDKKSTDYVYPQIIVQKVNQNNREECVLDVSVFDERSEYWVQVALRKNNIAAIGSDGMLYWWKNVPQVIKNVAVEGVEEATIEVLPRKKSSPRALLERMKPGRSRSNSGNKKSSGVPSLLTASDEGHLLFKQKSNNQISPKISPRSTEISPKVSPRSTEVSPKGSPRDISSKILSKQTSSSPQILPDKASTKHIIEDKHYHSAPEIVFNKTSSKNPIEEKKDDDKI